MSMRSPRFRGVFPLHYIRSPLLKDFYYAARKHVGEERFTKDLARICTANGTTDAAEFFRTDVFLRENGFRADVNVFFANHHEAHALAALFYTDWQDALVYTADGIGDNISHSVRSLRDGKLESSLRRRQPAQDASRLS